MRGLAGSECKQMVNRMKEVSKLYPHPECGKPCSDCGRPLDWRGKCHECLNDQFLNEEYDAYSEATKDGE